MAQIDTISDFLTRIRNALMAKHKDVEMPTSKMSERLAKILKEEGYISGFRTLPNKPRAILRLELRYQPDGKPMIREIKRLSTPGRHIYARASSIPEPSGGIATVILSTSRGIMTAQKAREQNVGGELLCSLI